MRNIELNDAELFKSLMEIDCGGIHIDLHNDFFCYKIDFKENALVVQFHSPELHTKKLPQEVAMLFNDVDVVNMSLFLQQKSIGKLTLDNFCRGRYEINGILKEFSKTGKKYYYLDFEEGYHIELFAVDVKVQCS